MLLQNVATAKSTLLSQCLAIIPEITSAPKLCKRGQFRSLLSPIPSTPRGGCLQDGEKGYTRFHWFAHRMNRISIYAHSHQLRPHSHGNMRFEGLPPIFIFIVWPDRDALKTELNHFG